MSQRKQLSVEGRRIERQGRDGQELAAININARGVVAVLALGAQAAVLGTRFLASTESRAHPHYKEKLLAAHEGDTVRTILFGHGWPNAPHRTLRTAFVQQWLGQEARGQEPRPDEPAVGQTVIGGQPMPVLCFMSLPPNSDASGEIDSMSLLAGQGVGLVREVKPAGQIVHELVEEARQIISQRLIDLVQPGCAGGLDPTRRPVTLTPLYPNGPHGPRRSLMSKKMEGKVAVITGGNSGIGLATARGFVAEGAHVFITGRRQAELDEAVRQIGRHVTGVQGDVSNLADLDRLFATVKQQQGRLDVLFANAGIPALAPLGEITEEHFDKVFHINVKGVLFTVQKALPLFTAGGSIILNASIVASKGLEAISVYSATKAAVRSFARCWTTDLRHRKIRVNTISPGPIETYIFHKAGLTREQVDEAKERLVAAVPLGRMGTPDEVANAAVFLASDDSSYVTGIELFVDGGMAQV